MFNFKKGKTAYTVVDFLINDFHKILKASRYGDYLIVGLPMTKDYKKVFRILKSISYVNEIELQKDFSAEKSLSKIKPAYFITRNPSNKEIDIINSYQGKIIETR